LEYFYGFYEEGVVNPLLAFLPNGLSSVEQSYHLFDLKTERNFGEPQYIADRLFVFCGCALSQRATAEV
jgi:hypothetical protein